MKHKQNGLIALALSLLLSSLLLTGCGPEGDEGGETGTGTNVVTTAEAETQASETEATTDGDATTETETDADTEDITESVTTPESGW